MSNKIRVAIVGVGNCASSLAQGLHYYYNAKTSKSENIGLISPVFNKYKISDIQIVAAFDVNARKVGQDVSEAIWKQPNNTKKFSKPPKTGCRANFRWDSKAHA